MLLISCHENAQENACETSTYDKLACQNIIIAEIAHAATAPVYDVQQ